MPSLTSFITTALVAHASVVYSQPTGSQSSFSLTQVLARGGKHFRGRSLIENAFAKYGLTHPKATEGSTGNSSNSPAV